jgi:hypothetical protein
MFRVMAVGRRALAADDERGQFECELAERNERVAADLSTSARKWREGTLR